MENLRCKSKFYPEKVNISKLEIMNFKEDLNKQLVFEIRIESCLFILTLNDLTLYEVNRMKSSEWYKVVEVDVLFYTFFCLGLTYEHARNQNRVN